MVTTRSLFGMRRTRSSAGPRRLLWLAALIGIALMHGVSVESGQGHLAVGVLTPAPVSADVAGHAAGPDGNGAAEQTLPPVATPDGGHDGHGDPHPAEECVSGKPQQTTVGAPCALPGGWRPPHAHAVDAARSTGTTAGIPAATATRHSVIQQV